MSMPPWRRDLDGGESMFDYSWSVWATCDRVKATFRPAVKQGFPRCMILNKKKSGWSSKNTLLSDVNQCTDARFLVACGTWRTWNKTSSWHGVWIVEWPMYAICIHDPLAIYIWSLSLYESLTTSLSCSPIIWSVAPKSAYLFESTHRMLLNLQTSLSPCMTDQTSYSTWR
jgi:hypothetical protein